MKRESGANPEQTRCCKLYEAGTSKATVFNPKQNGKAVQVWSKSEDLQSKIFGQLSRNKA